MAAFRRTFSLDTRPGVETIDVTDRVQAAIRDSGIREGIACIFTPSSTSALIANEFEPGLMKEDIPAALERLFPQGLGYGHEKRWQDGNGHSHVRAAFLGPSLTVPVADGEAVLGTWQQIVFVELDTKRRRRDIVVQVVGEGDGPTPRAK